MKLSLLFGLSAAKTIYFIRHAEEDSTSGKDLSPAGYKRADCLAKVFNNGEYPAPGTIVAQSPQDHSHRAVETATPLASVLGVGIQSSCGRDDIECAQELIKSSLEKVDRVLVVWEHGQLGSIAAKFVNTALQYPKSQYDIVWVVDPQTGTVAVDKQYC
ncbi:hypothetical protein HDV06_002457 [Boothiomyces sp. JEL0866]|nr:hypothetical protein HDV06_002457 [Boothiomyces sp. JEL0866]